MTQHNAFADLIPQSDIDKENPFADLAPQEDKGGMAKAFGAGVDKVQELGFRAVKGFTDVGNEGDGLIEKDGPVAQWAQEGIERNIEEQKEYEPTVKSYKDVDSVSDALSYTGELVAGSLPYMAGAMTGVGAITMGGGLSQEAYDKQPETEKNAVRALLSGSGQMLLERIGFRGSFGALGNSILKDGVVETAKKLSKKELVDIARNPNTALQFSKRILKGSTWEGVTEMGQEALAQWGAGKDISEISGLDEAFVGGLVVGGVLRTSTEGAQRVFKWNEQSTPIAKNGVDELVKQGVTQGEAINQIRTQLIETAQKQGLSEVEAVASAARTLKTEFGIDHEIFTPIANDVASRREALYEKMHKETVEGGFGRVQESLSNDGSLSPEQLIQQQMQENDPKFFEQLAEQDAQQGNKSTTNSDQGSANKGNLVPNVDKVTEKEGDLHLSENSSISEKDLLAEKPQKGKMTGLTVVEAPVNELSLSNDVPQFKDGANNKGVVEPLGGKFERTGVAPIQVWARENGDKEVISGRHRLDLAKRSGEQTIPAQYHYEEDGFNSDKAAVLDSLLNIREGQGKVKDYVEFIKATSPTEEEANADGILARQTGKRAYAIATQGSGELIAAHRANRLSDEAATRIAKAAPNNEALQTVGVKAIEEGKTIAVAENMVKAVGSMTQDNGQQTGDLFGFDDSALIEAENLAKAASKKQAEIQRTLSAVQGAAKRPELAAKEGVNVTDPDAVNKRIEQLKDEKRQWDNWHTNPKLVEQLHDKPIPASEQTPTKAASQEAVVVSEPKTIDEAAHEAATSPNNDLAEPTAAQAEANNYKLGRIEHSGLKIGIENPEGSYRKGIDSDGKEWSNKINHHYGDITGTKGADGDALDVFVKPGTESSDNAYVIDQVDPKTGIFDEHKIMLGFDSKAEAEKAYRANYDKDWKGLKDITEVDMSTFKGWIEKGNTIEAYAKQPVAKNKTDNKNDVIDFSSHKTVKDKVDAWFDIEPGDSIVDVKGNHIGNAFDKPKGRVIRVIDDKGNSKKVNVVAVAGKDGIIKGVDERVSKIKPVQSQSEKQSTDSVDKSIAAQFHERYEQAKTIDEVDAISNEVTEADKAGKLTDDEATKLDNSNILTRKNLGFVPEWQKGGANSRTVKVEPISDEVVSGFKTAKNISKWLASNAKEKAFRDIARTIDKIIDPSIKVVLLGDGSRRGGVLKGQFRYSELADGTIKKNQLEIYDQGKNEATLLHELIHAVTSKVLSNPRSLAQTEAVAKLRQVKSEIDRARMLNVKEWDSLTDREKTEFRTVGMSLDEFITYTLTNPHFQSGLKKLTVKNSSENFFSKLGQVFRSLLGLNNTTDDAFSRAIDASSAVIESATAKDTHREVKQDVKISTVENMGAETSTNNVTVEPLGKAWLVKGDTYPIKDAIKAKGGKWNRKQQGWVFPTSKEAEARSFISTTSTDGVAEKSTGVDTDNTNKSDQGKPDESDTSINQNKSAKQQSQVSSNEQSGVGEANESVSRVNLNGNGSIESSRDKPPASTKRSHSNDPQASSLNLDDVPNIANGTESERVKANLDAIRLLKKIQSENRKATLEEKQTLAKYVGWGGLKSVIDPKTKKKFAQEANKELKSLLTKAEFNGVSASITTAFYTSKDIVKAMWKGVEAFGLGGKSMNIIEPSVGSGNFIGWQPESMRKNSKWSATEIDPITGNIAALIYDDANVQVMGYQDAGFKQGVFSLAIGNPPFGSLKVRDNKLTDISGLSIHNYMVAKSSKLLHENGLMMMVITNRFLDTKNPNHSELSKTMDFVGAVRLPNTAFKSNAGTEVTTDVVVFRKLKKGEKATNTIWTDTEGSINGVRINKYFEANPQNILGEVSDQGTMYGDSKELTVNPTSEHENIGESLSNSLAMMAKGINLTPTNETLEHMAGEVMLSKSELPIGGMMIDAKGDIWKRNEDVEGIGAQVTKVTPKSIWRASGEILEQIRLLGKDKEALNKFAKEQLINAKTGQLKSSYNGIAFKALKSYLDGDLAFGTFRGKLLKAMDGNNGPRLGEKNYIKLRHILQLRNTALELIRAEKQDRDNIEQLRAKLNKEYDDFSALGTSKKPMTIDGNLALLRGDISIESGLDSISKAGKVTKHDIFKQRMIQPYESPTNAENIDDAVNFAMQEKGFVDVAYISNLMSISKAEARNLLVTGDRPYLLFDPVTNKDTFIDDYLSGNVKRKLKEAEAAGLEVNAKLLKSVQPTDKKPEQIKPSIRSPWMDKEIFTSFLDALGLKANVSVVPELGSIKIDGAPRITSTVLGDQFKNQYKISIQKIFEHAASGKAIQIYDTLPNKKRVKNEKATSQANVLVNKMVDSFVTWVNANPEIKEQITINFNERINTHVNRSYNGRLYLKTIGQNPLIDLRKTQLDGALRMIQTPNALLDHTVGAGKTFTAITGIMQRRRLGLSKKPMVVVPNHIIDAFKADFYALYPGANVLSVSGQQMSAKNRKQFFSRIATGDYDAIIIGHSHLKAIPNDQEATEQVYNEKLDELRKALETARANAKEAGGRGASTSQIENSITTLSDKLKAKKEALENKEDGIGFSFADLGVDYMVVDESHEFKNLLYSTSGDRVVGMNDPKGSEKALDLLTKTRSIQGLDNGGITFMTGTPISNSLVEIYTVMYYLGHADLKENNISHYDAFSGSFIDTQVALEYTPTGTVKERRVLKGLNNIKELTTKYRQFADVITQTDMVDIYAEDVAKQNKVNGTDKPTRFPIPKVQGGQRQLKSAKASKQQKTYNDYLIARMEAIASITGKQERLEYAKIDNPLWVLSDAKKASLDIRLIDPRSQRDPTGKVARAASDIKDIYTKTAKDKGTQLVFSDMGVPTKTAAKVARDDLKALAGYLMSATDATKFVKTSLATHKGDGYTKTLADLAEKIRIDADLDPDTLEKAEILMRELEGSTLTADTGFSVYDDLRTTMIANGIPSNEIAFIHDYDTPEKKKSLFDLVNSGEIRVLIGSTAKMGAGTNVQKRLVALHHMDAPWRPSDMEQREGRIIRQGNMFYERAESKGDPESFEVVINAYSTEGSSDPVMWQILERKSSAIEQFRRGDIDEFVEEANSDADSYANFKAQTTGNPIYKMKLESDGDLLQQQTDHTANALVLDGAKRIVSNYPGKKSTTEKVIAAYENASIQDFNTSTFMKLFNEQRRAYQDKLSEFNLEYMAWERLSDAKKKKNKKPTRPSNKSFYLLKDAYAKALNDNIIKPVVAAIDKGVTGDQEVVKELTLSKDMKLKVSVSEAWQEGLVDISVYLEKGGVSIDLEDASNVKTLTGSTRLIQSMIPSNIEREIENFVDRNVRKLQKIEHDYSIAKPKSEKGLSDKALKSAKRKNQWLEVEAGIADIKENIRRSKTSNQYIDSERYRKVKRSSFSESSIKPKTITWEGEVFKTLGVSIDSSHGFNLVALPAFDSAGKYVHLLARSQGEEKGLIIESVAMKPKDVPDQNYDFLTELQKPKNKEELPVKAWQQAKPINETLFSRTTSNADITSLDNGATVSELDTHKVIDGIVSSGGGLLSQNHFVVASSFNDLPNNIKDAAKDQGAEGEIKGVFHNGKTYLVRDQLADKLDVESTIFHETYGHYGIRKLFGKELPKKLNQLLAGIGGIDGLTKIANKHGVDLGDYHKGLAKSSLTNEQAQTVLMDELLAHLAQDNRPSVMRKVKEVIGAIRQWLKNSGFVKLEKVTDNELFYILKQARIAAHESVESNNDIRFSRAKKNVEGSVNLKDESRKEATIRILQDKFRRLKLIQRELTVNDSNDTYMAEEAFHGKVGEDLRKLQLHHTDKIADTMAKHDLSQDEVDLYLIAKHASERNAFIDTINPELNGAGSGMSNDAAQAILDKAVFENKRLALENVAKHVYAMLKENREMMVGFGLEAQDAIDTWQKQYKYYVPLKGYAAEDGVKDAKGKKFASGKGFNIKGRETIKAMGRRSLAESPLLHAISDTTQAVIRARKNEVGNTFLKLVNDNPEPELWEVFTAEKPDKKRGNLPDGSVGIVDMSAFEMQSKDEYFKTKLNGIEQYVKIKDPLLARAMSNLGVDETNMLTQNLGKVTRLLSALVTTWNPEFIITNFTRDVQAAMANVLAETQVKDGKALNTEGLAKKMIKSLPKAMSVLKQGFRSDNFNDKEWGPYLKEFLESGAKTGWVNQKDIEALASDLKGAISRASNTTTGKVRRGGKAVADFVSDYNDIVENSARFSVYYHARKQGISVKKASSLAKNLTINFNRKGEISNTMNAIFMFANASVQGTANMMRALATPKDRSKSMWNPAFYNLSQKVAIGSIGATILMANLMREFGGDDEDGVPFYDKVPDHVKATNYVLMTGGKDYIAIPMPYGYNFLAGIGHSIDGVINGKSAIKQASNLLFSALSTFSPIGAQDSKNIEKGFIKTLTPTVLKPFVEMGVNENFFGSGIYPNQNSFSANKADAHLGSKYTWEWTKNLTTWLNDVTGGSEFRSGQIDIAPQSIDHLVKFMGGGVLQFAARWQNLAAKNANGKEINSADIPFYRRFIKEINPKATIGEFYDDKHVLVKYFAEFKSLRGQHKVEFRREYSEQLKLHNIASKIEKSLRALNKQKRAIEASNLPESIKNTKVDNIENRKISLALRFSEIKNKSGLRDLF